MRPTVALVVVFAALALAAFGGAGRAPVASGHALLVGAEPPVNAAVQEPPRELTLRFSEPLERKFSTVEVTDQDGDRLDQAVTFDDTDGAVMRVALAEAGPGYLVVSWETVSVVDGHRITGSYPITVLNPDGSAPAMTPPPATSIQGDETRPGLVVARFLLLAGGAVLVGALLFSLWVAPAFVGNAGASARSASGRWAALAATIALAVIALAGVLELAVHASDLGRSAADVLGTRWGERWLLRHAAFAVALAALAATRFAPRLRTPAAILAVIATAGAFAAVSSTSHAAAGEGAVWATAADFVHLLAASVWIGLLSMVGLLFLWARRRLVLEERQAVLATALVRFSGVAAVSVALLLFTGAVSAVVEVARLDDLVDSAYGRALLLKLLLLLPLFGVAGYNALVLRPNYVAADASEPTPRADAGIRSERLLTRTVNVEIAVALAVFAVVGVLVQINPTRASAAQSGPDPYTATKQAEAMSVSLAVEPNVPGFNTFTVDLAGHTDSVEQVRLEFFDRSGATSESRLELEAVEPRERYTGQGPFLSTAADWQVRVNLRRSQGSDLSVPFDVPVGGGATAPGRGGDFASPVDWDAARVAIVLGTAVISAAVALATLRASSRVGGSTGCLGPATPGRQAGAPDRP